MKLNRLIPLLVLPAILAACGQQSAEVTQDASAPTVKASAPAADTFIPKETPVPAPADASAPSPEAASAPAL